VGITWSGCAAASRRWRPTSATGARSPGAVRFGYVLPISARRALVDVVTICPSRCGVDVDQSGDPYLALILGGAAATVTRHESAEIPLRP